MGFAIQATSPFPPPLSRPHCLRRPCPHRSHLTRFTSLPADLRPRFAAEKHRPTSPEHPVLRRLDGASSLNNLPFVSPWRLAQITSKLPRCGNDVKHRLENKPLRGSQTTFDKRLSQQQATQNDPAAATMQHFLQWLERNHCVDNRLMTFPRPLDATSIRPV